MSGWFADRVAGPVFIQLSRWVVEGARWMLAKLFGTITTLTTPDLGASWLVDHIARVGRISMSWLALVYLAAAIDAAIRARGGVLLRAVAVTPVAFAGAGVAVFVLELITTAFDESADWLMTSASQDLTAFGERLGLALLQVDVEQAAFVALLAALGVTLAAVVIWVELLMREIALYLTASFVPLAVAGAVWPVTAHWLPRLARLAVALAAWKFVIVSTVTMGAALLAHGGAERGIAAVLAGLGTLMLAAFAPFVVLRIAQVWDVDGVGGIQGGLTSAAGRMLSPVMAAAGLGFAAHRMIHGPGAAAVSGSPASAPAADEASNEHQQGSDTSRLVLLRPHASSSQSIPHEGPPRSGGGTATAPLSPSTPPEGASPSASGGAAAALTSAPPARALPSAGGAVAELPAGHIDSPQEWIGSPDGSVDPSYPETPSAAMPGGWWIVPTDGSPRPAHPDLPSQPPASESTPQRPLPRQPLPITDALLRRRPADPPANP